MKITPEDYATLEAAIAPHNTPARRETYRTGAFPRAELTKDINKRYRWDLLHVATSSAFVCGLYDKGLDDTHIDTALRNIVPAL